MQFLTRILNMMFETILKIDDTRLLYGSRRFVKYRKQWFYDRLQNILEKLLPNLLPSNILEELLPNLLPNLLQNLLLTKPKNYVFLFFFRIRTTHNRNQKIMIFFVVC